MTPKTGTDFRRSIETKILKLHNNTGVPIPTIRKTLAFNRFLARLAIALPHGWVLKGGFFMQLQFHQKARTTRDIDLLFTEQKKNIRNVLMKASKVPLSDWFAFEVGAASVEGQVQEKTTRYEIHSLLDSRTFENFHLDINSSDILFGKPVGIPSREILDIPEFGNFEIPCYSLPQQIAEKFHALTKPYGAGVSSRVKDLVDILLIAGQEDLSFQILKKAIFSTFQNRNTHPIPQNVPEVLVLFPKEYSSLASKLDIRQKTVLEANKALDKFLTTILSGDSKKTWDHINWNWS
jgi:hypothetical protein